MNIIVDKFIIMCFQTACLLDYRKEIIQKKSVQIFRIIINSLGVSFLFFFQYVILNIGFDNQNIKIILGFSYVIIVYKLVDKYANKYYENKIRELNLFEIEFTFFNKLFYRFIGVLLTVLSPGLLLAVAVLSEKVYNN